MTTACCEMEYLIPKVLVMTATIMVAVGDGRERSYESNQLGSSDLTYNGHGPHQGYQERGHDGHDQGSHGYEKGGSGKDYYAEPHYAFAYEVHDDHTGDIKAHKEERKGDHTQGMYMLVEPNGSKRIVEYVVQGKSGFNAKVHQSKPQGPHAGHTQAGHGGNTGGYSSLGGNTGGYSGHSGNTGGYSGHSGNTGGYSSHTGNTGGYSGHTGNTGGYSGHTGNTGGYSGHSGSTGGYSSLGGSTGGYSGHSGSAGEYSGHSGNTGGYSGYSGNTGHPTLNTNTEGYHSGLGDYATGYYTSHKQSPYKVQENTPTFNHKPSLSYNPPSNLQPFKPLIPYIPPDPQNSKNSFPHRKPLIALYRPQTSYKPLSSDNPTSYKFVPVQRQNSPDGLHTHGHATSSVSFLSHGSKIASTTNHLMPQQKSYENKH